MCYYLVWYMVRLNQLDLLLQVVILKVREIDTSGFSSTASMSLLYMQKLHSTLPLCSRSLFPRERFDYCTFSIFICFRLLPEYVEGTEDLIFLSLFQKTIIGKKLNIFAYIPPKIPSCICMTIMYQYAMRSTTSILQTAYSY